MKSLCVIRHLGLAHLGSCMGLFGPVVPFQSDKTEVIGVNLMESPSTLFQMYKLPHSKGGKNQTCNIQI